MRLSWKEWFKKLWKWLGHLDLFITSTRFMISLFAGGFMSSVAWIWDYPVPLILIFGLGAFGLGLTIYNQYLWNKNYLQLTKKIQTYIEFQVSIQVAKPHIIQSTENEDVWYIVFERATFVNKNRDHRLSIDSMIQFFANSPAISQPIPEWEKMKARDAVEDQPLLPMPITLEPASFQHGYLAFRLTNLRQWFGSSRHYTDTLVTAPAILKLIVKDLHSGKEKTFEVYKGALTFTSHSISYW